jgi:peroxiredoxin Q/BCP
MAQLRLDHEEFERRGARIVVLGPEGRDAFVKYWKAHDLPFTGLPDPEHRVLDLYGQKWRLLGLGRMPALAVVDREGMLRYVHHGSSMRDIPTNEAILAVIDGN